MGLAALAVRQAVAFVAVGMILSNGYFFFGVVGLARGLSGGDALLIGLVGAGAGMVMLLVLSAFSDSVASGLWRDHGAELLIKAALGAAFRRSPPSACPRLRRSASIRSITSAAFGCSGALTVWPFSFSRIRSRRASS